MDPIYSEETRVIFVWLDLEMTGLIPEQDRILEIATVLTDTQLNVIEQGPSLVVHQPDAVLEVMSDVVTQMHKQSGLYEAVQQSTYALTDAQQYTCNFLEKYNDDQTIFQLAGNSVYQDRAFIRQHMPQLHTMLHYRLIDVSTVKSLVRYWYPKSAENRIKKEEVHRALDDAYESIEELRHYRKHFFG